jgi:hypothetical protein
MPKQATLCDYIILQGGRPFISQDEYGLYHIKHNYRDDQPEVITHISPEERGTVIIGNIEYQASLVWKFEGAPCERLSRMHGGEGYTRHGKEK